MVLLLHCHEHHITNLPSFHIFPITPDCLLLPWLPSICCCLLNLWPWLANYPKEAFPSKDEDFYLEYQTVDRCHYQYNWNRFPPFPPWSLCSSCTIWSHSLDALSLEWTGSWCSNWAPGLSDLANAPIKHVEWVTMHPCQVVLYVTPYTKLRMASLFFFSSHQFWSHKLGALRLGLTPSQYIDWVTGLSYLAHVLKNI